MRLANVVKQEPISKLDQLQRFEVLTELVTGLQRQGVYQVHSFHRDIKVIA